MTTLIRFALSVLFLPLVSLAETTKPIVVGIVDSGIDYEDPRIKNAIFHQPTAESGAFKGDEWGWDAVKSQPHVFKAQPVEAAKLKDFSKYNLLEGFRYVRDLTPDEDSQVRDLEKKMPLKAYYDFGTYAHGQHVSGIVLRGTQNTRILPVTYLRLDEKDENPLNGFTAEQILNVEIDPEFLAELPAKYTAHREIVAAVYVVVRYEISRNLKSFDYVAARPMSLVNMSIGSGLTVILSRAFENIWAANFMAKPSDQVKEIYVDAIQKYISKKFVVQLLNNKDKLFVQAAGNKVDDSSRDLDKFPQYPTSLRKWYDPENIIIVAAAEDQGLAEFSSYGALTVDIAAPGVNINSFAPGGLTMMMSGTSQATAYITNVAARVLEINPKLRPADVKKILMNTVDQKDVLVGQVKSGGIVNTDRALRAAKLSLNKSLDLAVAQANSHQQN